MQRNLGKIIFFHKTGPYNLSGDWTGVMGDVVEGKYPLSLSAWSWMIERNGFLDFVPIIKENLLLSIVPQQPKVDLTLFIRPFRPETWHGVLVVVLLVLFVLMMSQKAISMYGTKSGYKIVILVSWISFVLINAYFGGALTMFFSSDVSLPFDTLREVLQKVPDWKLLSLKGMDATYEIPALQVLYEALFAGIFQSETFFKTYFSLLGRSRFFKVLELDSK